MSYSQNRMVCSLLRLGSFLHLLTRIYIPSVSVLGSTAHSISALKKVPLPENHSLFISCRDLWVDLSLQLFGTNTKARDCWAAWQQQVSFCKTSPSCLSKGRAISTPTNNGLELVLPHFVSSIWSSPHAFQILAVPIGML